MLSPAKTSTRPSGSSVAVGYQRPTVMSGAAEVRVGLRVEDRRVGEAVVGADVAADDERPAVGELDVAGAEEISPVGNAVKVPRPGSQSRSEFGAASQPSHVRTCPVGSSDMWTATSGHATGALHWPTWSGVGPAACEPPRGISVKPTRQATKESRRQKGSDRQSRWVWSAAARNSQTETRRNASSVP